MQEGQIEKAARQYAYSHFLQDIEKYMSLPWNEAWDLYAETLAAFGRHCMKDVPDCADGKQEKDADGEEMLTVSAITVREMYVANERIKTDTPDKELGRTSDHINHVLRCLFGSKCLPDEPNDVASNVANSEPKSFKYSVGQKVILHFYGGEVSMITEAFYDGWKRKYKVKALPHHVWNENELDPYEEPQPAEPQFKEGDKVVIIANCKHQGEVTEIIYVDDDMAASYKLDIYDDGKWYTDADLEPYTEPQPATECSNLNKESSTCTDDCPSQCSSKHRNLLQETANCDKQFDNILKDSFRTDSEELRQRGSAARDAYRAGI